LTVELKEFITQTLSDILKGVTTAQGDASIGNNVAPWGIGGAKYPGGIVQAHSGALIAVKFDVAVRAESSDQTKGGGAFKVAVLGMGASAGGEIGAASKNVAVTRIQFDIPILLPAGDQKA
jgi:hypothetical protein